MIRARIGTRGTQRFLVTLTIATGMALLAVSGVAAQAGSTEAATDPKPYPPEENLVDYLARLRAEFGLVTADRLRTALGRPDSIDVEVVRNRHYANDEDAAITLYYPGAIAGIYYVSRNGKEILGHFWITGADRTRNLPVGIGDSTEDLVDFLGPPAFIRGDVYRYWFGEATNLLDFQMADGRIVEIQIEYYSG